MNFRIQADPLRPDMLIDSLSKWENVIVLNFSNNNQQMNLFSKEVNMFKTLLSSIPGDLKRFHTQKALQPIGGSNIAIIKTIAQKNSLSNSQNKNDDKSKTFKMQASFYVMSGDGVMDFGKFAFDKIKIKKDPSDIEKVPILSQVVEDQKIQEIIVKGLTKLETSDPEQLINFFMLSSSYFNEYLLKRFPDSDEKIYHSFFQLTFWNPNDSKKRAHLFFIDLAVPVQANFIEQIIPNLNPFLNQSLVNLSAYLKEYHKDKANVTLPSIANAQIYGQSLNLINFESTLFMKLLKKILISQETIIIPLFVVNSKEEFKDESKQILTFTQQLQGLNRNINDDLSSRILTPKDGSQSPQEDLAQAIMMDKLSKENNELRRQFEHIKKLHKAKLDDLRMLVGIDVDLETLIKARPNSKEMHTLKFYREAKERAETLSRINRDLEKKLNSLSDEVDQIRMERMGLDKKYMSQFRSMESKIEKLTNEIQNNEKTFGTQITEEKNQRSSSITSNIQTHYSSLQEKANLLFKIGLNTDNNCNTLGRAYDSKDQGKRFAEHQYKKELLQKTRDYKEEMQKMKKQHEENITNFDQQILECLNCMKSNKQQIQEKVQKVREELIALYRTNQDQTKLIQNVEDGVYTQGLHSHYVPPSQKPVMPTKDTHKQLFTSISKQKVKDTLQQKYEGKNPKKQKSDKFLETFLMKTQIIQQTGQEQIKQWNERLKSQEPEMIKTDDIQVPSLLQKQKQPAMNDSKSKQKETQQNMKQPSLAHLKELNNSIEDLDFNQLGYNDLQQLVGELQKEFKKLVESDLYPQELNGEPLKKVVADIDKFKQLYEHELKISNERIYHEGKFMRQYLQTGQGQRDTNQQLSTGRPETRQLSSSQSMQRLISCASRQGLQTGYRNTRPINYMEGSLDYQKNDIRAVSRGIISSNMIRVPSRGGFLNVRNKDNNQKLSDNRQEVLGQYKV